MWFEVCDCGVSVCRHPHAPALGRIQQPHLLACRCSLFSFVLAGCHRLKNLTALVSVLSYTPYTRPASRFGRIFPLPLMRATASQPPRRCDSLCSSARRRSTSCRLQELFCVSANAPGFRSERGSTAVGGRLLLPFTRICSRTSPSERPDFRLSRNAAMAVGHLASLSCRSAPLSVDFGIGFILSNRPSLICFALFSSRSHTQHCSRV